MLNTLEYRPAKLPSCCRLCEKDIIVGESILTFSTYQSRGGQIILCVECTKQIAKLAENIQ